MNIELIVNNAWQKKAWWLWLLLPFSWLYGLITQIKRMLFKYKVLTTYRAPIPIMIVGNITVGGSGKTPLLIELVSYLQSQNIDVGVISRGYGGDESIMPCIVTASSAPTMVGDEPCLIVGETGVSMSVCPNRQLAIECLLQFDPKLKLIIADDGLQHYKLERDIEWIVVDSMRGFGNRQLLPTGYLRERHTRLNDATVIYHQPLNLSTSNYRLPEASNNGNADINDDQAALIMQLQPAALTPLKSSITTEQSLTPSLIKRVYAVSGIGYPQRFFDTIRSLGFEVIEYPMPDHHQYRARDLSQLTQYPIIITSKDAIKIAPLVRQDSALASLSIWILPVQAVLSDSCYQTLMSQLEALNIAKDTKF